MGLFAPGFYSRAGQGAQFCFSPHFYMNVLKCALKPKESKRQSFASAQRQPARPQNQREFNCPPKLKQPEDLAPSIRPFPLRP